jgi:hypothetical protein
LRLRQTRTLTIAKPGPARTRSILLAPVLMMVNARNCCSRITSRRLRRLSFGRSPLLACGFCFSGSCNRPDSSSAAT